MKKMSKKIVFFGTEDFSASSLQALINAKFEIAAIITKPNSQRGRGKKMSEPIVKTIAKQHNIDVWQPENVSDIRGKIEKIENKVGILVSYGKLIPTDILELFEPIGIINLHPSLLPKYRGPSPIESAILNGDSEIGVSIMKLTSEMDAGPVYSQVEVALDGNEYADNLYKKLSQKGAEQLVSSLPLILDGNLKLMPQNKTVATYCQLITKDNGIIDWKKPAKRLEREIRAYYIWPKSRTKLGDIEVIIRKAHSVPTNTGEIGKIDTDNENYLMIETHDGRICVDIIQPLGKKEMSVKSFLTGYKTKIIVQ